MERLGQYMASAEPQWLETRQRAAAKNGWFIPEFIDLAAHNIIAKFLDKTILTAWANHYHTDDNITPRTVGIVMAGNIPLVGFHDLLATFIAGHRQRIKPSAKDEVLIQHLVEKMQQWAPRAAEMITITENLKNCDAYIATGSNNSSRYFEQYFAKYPHIIRRNKTSAALLTGSETDEELALLSNDIHQYFGLGCRNVSKIFVPRNIDFNRLLQSFENFAWLAENHKYKNNFDYQLSIILLNRQQYFTNGTTLLTENTELFSPISNLFYEFYDEEAAAAQKLQAHSGVQCIVGKNHIPFGQAQEPGLFQYADGVDTMAFLLGI